MPADRDELVPGPAYPMGAPHHRDTHETEVAAARRMTPLLRGCQGAVVVALRAHPAGLTTCELCEQPDLVRYDRLTVGARVTELQNHGWVRASGFKRKSWREQDMNVWVLCDPLPTTAPPQRRRGPKHHHDAARCDSCAALVRGGESRQGRLF